MKRYVGCVVVAALFLSAGQLRAQDTYPIKFKGETEGDVGQVDRTETTIVTTKVVDGAGKALVDQKKTVVDTSSFIETVKKCEKGKTATLVERKYDKAIMTTDGEKKELPYQGKTVVIEKKGGKYTFSVDGKALAGDDAASLSKEFKDTADDKFDFVKALQPKDAVKVNGSWKLDMEPYLKDIRKDGNVEVDADKCKGTCTLMKAYKKDGMQFGEVKVEMTYPVKSLGSGAMKLVGQEGSVATLDLTLDVCIDGTAQTGTSKANMKLDLKSSPDGMVKINVSMQNKVEEIRKDLSKK